MEDEEAENDCSGGKEICQAQMFLRCKNGYFLYSKLFLIIDATIIKDMLLNYYFFSIFLSNGTE